MDFLVKNILNKIYTGKLEVITDKETQLKGIDIILSDGNHDAKAQTNTYYNTFIPTFCMEVSFIRSNGEEVIGWFLDETKETDYYDLIYVPSAKVIKEDKNFKLSSPDDIKKFEMITVKAQDVREYVKKHISAEDAIQVARDMRNGKVELKNGTIYYKNGLKFFLSKKLPEKPVNIVIPKKEYIKMAKNHIVYDEGKIIDAKKEKGKYYDFCNKVEKEIRDRKQIEEELSKLEVKCPRCGRELKLRTNSKGEKFFGCSGYAKRECDYATSVECAKKLAKRSKLSSVGPKVNI